jgi:hypothetical protein
MKFDWMPSVQRLVKLQLREGQVSFGEFELLRPCVVFMCLCSSIGCGGAKGPVKYPVSGVVTVNGEPAERVAVVFHHADQSVGSSLRFPTAVSDADGIFHLSSEGDRDGVIAGGYSVTFTWLSSPDLDSFDMFNGAFGAPNTSEFKVEVPLESPGIVELDIVVPEERIYRSRPLAKQLRKQ